MNQSYNTRYKEMQENNPAAPAVSEERSYAQAGYVRNVYFLPLTGPGLFLNYAYLVGCEHSTDFTALMLTFTTHQIELQGIFLKPLFFELMAHIPRIIEATEARYNAISNQGLPLVNEIVLRASV